MNTKSALIIAVAIVIGFSIEPILDRVDFSDPAERLIKVVDTRDDEHMGYAYEFYVRVGDFSWNRDSKRRWHSTPGYFYPADEHALQAIFQAR